MTQTPLSHISKPTHTEATPVRDIYTLIYFPDMHTRAIPSPCILTPSHAHLRAHSQVRWCGGNVPWPPADAFEPVANSAFAKERQPGFSPAEIQSYRDYLRRLTTA